MPHEHGVRSAGVLAAAALLVACSGEVEPAPAVPTPPPPPAACLLDVDALAAATGLPWTPEPATAGDVRCVYDARQDDPLAFLAVELAPPVSPAELEDVAAACTDGSRTTVAAGRGAFVCTLPAGSILGAVAADDHLITVAASQIPAGTTADELAPALASQLVHIAPLSALRSHTAVWEAPDQQYGSEVGSELAGGAQPAERLLEDGRAVGVAAPLLHVREVGLVRLGARRRRGVLVVAPGRQAAARAVPLLGDLRLGGEGRRRDVPVRAEVRDPLARGRLAALGLAHRTGPHPRAADRVAASHPLSPSGGRRPRP